MGVKDVDRQGKGFVAGQDGFQPAFGEVAGDGPVGQAGQSGAVEGGGDDGV